MYSCSHTIDDIENEESFDVTFFGSVTVDNQNVIHEVFGKPTVAEFMVPICDKAEWNEAIYTNRQNSLIEHYLFANLEWIKNGIEDNYFDQRLL